MNVVLPPEQEQWLNARIAEGEFTSPEAAVRQMIAERMALDADDFAWAVHMWMKHVHRRCAAKPFPLMMPSPTSMRIWQH